MANHPDSLSAACALIGSLGMHAPEARATLPMPVASVRHCLRTAQVELYCDHDHAALHALLKARHDMAEYLPPSSSQLQAMEVALWHVRRHELDAAQQAIAFLNDQLTGVNH